MQLGTTGPGDRRSGNRWIERASEMEKKRILDERRDLLASGLVAAGCCTIIAVVLWVPVARAGGDTVRPARSDHDRHDQVQGTTAEVRHPGWVCRRKVRFQTGGLIAGARALSRYVLLHGSAISGPLLTDQIYKGLLKHPGASQCGWRPDGAVSQAVSVTGIWPKRHT